MKYGGALPDFVGASLFSEVSQNRIDFTDQAFELAEKGAFASEPILYLGQSVKNERDLHRLSELRVRPDLENAKDIAIKDVEGRLALGPAR